MEMSRNLDRIRRFTALMRDVAENRHCELEWVHVDTDGINVMIRHRDYQDFPFSIRLPEYADLTKVVTNVWAEYFEKRQKKPIPDGVAGIKLDIQCTDMVEKLRQLDANCLSVMRHANKIRSIPDITDVIFNDPATIVFWSDKTKTVVKCQDGDEFDPEKGLVMAIVKKLYGNKGSYCNEIKKWTEPYYAKLAEEELNSLDDFLTFLQKCAARGARF